jgi:hypothetical protein
MDTEQDPFEQDPELVLDGFINTKMSDLEIADQVIRVAGCRRAVQIAQLLTGRDTRTGQGIAGRVRAALRRRAGDDLP